jgi:hypothetical protein
LNAIHENIAEHRGVFTCGTTTRQLPNTPTVVMSTTSISDYPGDIAPCVVPDYISSLPFDPSLFGAHYVSTTDYNTRYEIFVDKDGRLTASSTGELTPTISVTR